MTRISIGNTLGTDAPEIYESSLTVRQVLEQYGESKGIDYRRSTWNINGGRPLSNEELDTTLAGLGYEGKDIFLMSIVNAKNA